MTLDRPLPPHLLAAIARGEAQQARRHGASAAKLQEASLDRQLAAQLAPGPDGTPDRTNAAAKPRRNKYGVAPREERTRGSFVFDSKAEALRWDDLELLRLAGVVLFTLRQVPFHLPGGVVYRCDFQVHYRDGRVVHEDVKGVRTRAFAMKAAQVAELYGVRIVELPGGRQKR